MLSLVSSVPVEQAEATTAELRALDVLRSQAQRMASFKEKRLDNPSPRYRNLCQTRRLRRCVPVPTSAGWSAPLDAKIGSQKGTCSKIVSAQCDPLTRSRPINMPWAVDEILLATVLPPPGHSLDRWLVFGAGLATTALRRWSADARLRGTAFAGVLAGQKGLGAGVRPWFESRCVFDPG